MSGGNVTWQQQGVQDQKSEISVALRCAGVAKPTGGGVQVAGERIIGTKSTSETDGWDGWAA